MYSAEALEAINVDQIATATDRLLLGQPAKRRPSRRPSQLEIRQEDEVTVFVRHTDVQAAATMKSALFGALVGATAACSAIAIACLLA